MVTPVTSLTTQVKDVVLRISLMVEEHIMIFFLRYVIRLVPKIHFVFSGVRQETVEYVILLMLLVMLTLVEKLPR